MPESAVPRVRSLADAIRSWEAAELARLLDARPDLRDPIPADIRELALRAGSPDSVRLALDQLTTRELAVLEVLTAATVPLSASQLAERCSLLQPHAVAVLGRLRDIAVVWTDDQGLAHVVRAAADVFGPYPCTLLPPLAHTRTLLRRFVDQPQEVLDRVKHLSPVARDLLLTLVSHGPTIEHPQASRLHSMEGATDPAAELVHEGLLLALNDSTLGLPREVALPLRDGVWKTIPTELAITADPTDDRVAAGLDAAIAAVADVNTLLQALRAQPVKLGRNQVLNRQDMARLATHCHWQEEQLLRVAACAAAAGLLALATDPQDCLTVHQSVEQWEELDMAEQWARIAVAWRESAALVTCLLARQTLDARGIAPAYFADAKAACQTWSALRADAVPLTDDCLAVMRPRVATNSSSAFDVARRTSEWLGLTVDFRWSPLAAHLDSMESLADAVRQMQGPGIEHFFVQPDHTVIVPGRPAPHIRRVLRDISVTESEDRAFVARLTAASLRHGMDRGHTADQISHFLTKHSATGLPQSLEYLVRDLERSPRQIEIASNVCLLTFPPASDSSTVAALLDSAGFQLLAEDATSMIVRGNASDVERVLHGAGLTPQARRHAATPNNAANVTSQALVSSFWPKVTFEASNITVAQVLLHGQNRQKSASSDSDDLGDRDDSGSVATRLQAAAKSAKDVRITFVNPDGSPATSRGPVMHLGHGFVTIYDEVGQLVRTIAVSSISSVNP